MGCGPQPKVIQIDFAAIGMIGCSCNSYETKFKTFKIKLGPHSSDLNYMLKITAFYVFKRQYYNQVTIHDTFTL
jgi:hypothetical protein